MAVREATLIRAVWYDYYKMKYSPKTGPTAYEIAAGRWGVSVEDVELKRVTHETRAAK